MARYDNLYNGILKRPSKRQPIVNPYNDPLFDVIPDNPNIHDYDRRQADHRMRLLNEYKQNQEELAATPDNLGRRGDRAWNDMKMAQAQQFLKRSYDEGEANKEEDDYRAQKNAIRNKYAPVAGVLDPDASGADNYTGGSRFPRDPRRDSGFDIGDINGMREIKLKPGQKLGDYLHGNVDIEGNPIDVNDPNYEPNGMFSPPKTSSISDPRNEPTVGGTTVPSAKDIFDPYNPTREFPLKNMPKYPPPNGPKGGIVGADDNGLNLIPVPRNGRMKGRYGEPLPPSNTGPANRPKPVTGTVVPDVPARIKRPTLEPPIDTTGRVIEPDPSNIKGPYRPTAEPTVVPDPPVNIKRPTKLPDVPSTARPIYEPSDIIPRPGTVAKGISDAVKDIIPEPGALPIGVGGAGNAPGEPPPSWPKQPVDPIYPGYKPKTGPSDNGNPGPYSPNMGPWPKEPNMSVGEPADPNDGIKPEPEIKPAPIPADAPKVEEPRPSFRLTPRSILSQRPPRPQLHDPALMNTNRKSYDYNEQRPEIYNVDQGPNISGPQRIEDIKRFDMPMPNQEGRSADPKIYRPENIKNYGPYDESRPNVYGAEDAPQIGNQREVSRQRRFDENRPDVYNVDRAPDVTNRDTNFGAYDRPGSVGRMGSVERFDKFSALNKNEIERPDKLAPMPERGGPDWNQQFIPKSSLEEYKQRGMNRDKGLAWRAGMGDLGNALRLKTPYEGRSAQALNTEYNRQKDFFANEDQRKTSVANRNIATRKMDLEEGQIKAGIAQMASQANVQLRQQDMNYIIEGAKLGQDEYKARIGERLGLGHLALEGDKTQMEALKNYQQSAQESERGNINASQMDIGNTREATRLGNQDLVSKAGIVNEQDKAQFDRWAATQGFNKQQYDSALNRWKSGADQNLAENAQDTGVNQFNAANAKDYEGLGQQRFVNDQNAKYQRQQALNQRYQQGFMTHKDYVDRSTENQKFDVTANQKRSDQELNQWKSLEDVKDRSFNSGIRKWEAQQKNEFDYLGEKRARFGLNTAEQRKYDELGLDKWKIGETFKAEKYKNNLERWSKGEKLNEFTTQEERQRFDSNNQAVYRADANALQKYGEDAKMWKEYNKLPSEIRKDEAMADLYMEQAKAEKDPKEKDPLKFAAHIDNFNKMWTGSKEYQDYQQSGQYFGKIVNAPATGFGDTAAIYGFIKSIDPSSSVREGERDFAVKAMGWLSKQPSDKLPAGIARAFQKLATGQLMGVEDRIQLADAAYSQTKISKFDYDNMLNKHKKTWGAQPALAPYTDMIQTVPDWSGGIGRDGQPQYKSTVRNLYGIGSTTAAEKDEKAKKIAEDQISKIKPIRDQLND